MHDSCSYLDDREFRFPAGRVAFLEDCYYCPKFNVLLDDRKRLVLESLYPGIDPSKLERNEFAGRKVATITGTSTVFRGQYKAPFHTLLTELPRVIMASMVDSSGTLRLLCEGGMKPWEAETIVSLLPDGPEIEAIDLDQSLLYKLEKVYLPTFINPKGSVWLPDELRDHYQPLYPDRQRNPSRLIYISREKYRDTATKRHVLNEDRVFESLERLGFEKIAPEELSAEERTELFYDAKVVVGAHGSALTNVLFSERAHVIELLPMNHLFPYFYFLCQMQNCRHDFVVCGDHSGLMNNFSVSDDALAELLSLIEVDREDPSMDRKES